jgi:hypothetical protein
MEELSLHILDIVENSVAAQADRVEIIITVDQVQDKLSVEVIDNGTGMDEETAKRALDPFYTSKTVRRFGFGLPLLSEAARAANGHMSVESKKGEGTKIRAEFQYSHIDRQPLGDIGQTIITLVFGNPEVDFIYVFKKNDQEYRFDTRIVKDRLDHRAINSPAGIRMIREELKEMPK